MKSWFALTPVIGDAEPLSITITMEYPMIKAFVFDAYGTLYDVQSVSNIIEKSFPGHGDYITQVWRMKQLEYSWLRSIWVNMRISGR